MDLNAVPARTDGRPSEGIEDVPLPSAEEGFTFNTLPLVMQVAQTTDVTPPEKAKLAHDTWMGMRTRKALTMKRGGRSCVDKQDLANVILPGAYAFRATTLVMNSRSRKPTALAKLRLCLQEASKRPARGQQEASKRAAKASKKPAKGQQDGSKKPARGQQEASKRQERGKRG